MAKLKLLLAGTCLGENMELALDVADPDKRFRSQIIINGFVPDEDINYLYNRALFSVYMSFEEGFGMPILESLTFGCPVISSNTSSMPEVYGDAAIAVSPFDDEGFIRAMETLCTHPEERERLRAKGFQQAKKFSWEKYGELLLQDCLNRNRDNQNV